MLIENADGQVSLFDQDTWCGKTCQELSAATAEQTSKPSSRKRSVSRSRTRPTFHYLKKESGLWQMPTMGTGGALPTEFLMLNSGECHKDAEGLLWLPILEDGQQEKYCLTLNIGEKPRWAIPTKLSDILEDNPNPKYNLSAKACQGILNRAQLRGKPLGTDCKSAYRTTEERGPEDKRVFCYGLEDAMTDYPLEKCVVCGAFVRNEEESYKKEIAAMEGREDG